MDAEQSGSSVGDGDVSLRVSGGRVIESQGQDSEAMLSASQTGGARSVSGGRLEPPRTLESKHRVAQRKRMPSLIEFLTDSFFKNNAASSVGSVIDRRVSLFVATAGTAEHKEIFQSIGGRRDKLQFIHKILSSLPRGERLLRDFISGSGQEFPLSHFGRAAFGLADCEAVYAEVYPATTVRRLDTSVGRDSTPQLDVSRDASRSVYERKDSNAMNDSFHLNFSADNVRSDGAGSGVVQSGDSAGSGVIQSGALVAAGVRDILSHDMLEALKPGLRAEAGGLLWNLEDLLLLSLEDLRTQPFKVSGLMARRIVAKLHAHLGRPLPVGGGRPILRSVDSSAGRSLPIGEGRPFLRSVDPGAGVHLEAQEHVDAFLRATTEERKALAGDRAQAAVESGAMALRALGAARGGGIADIVTDNEVKDFTISLFKAREGGSNGMALQGMMAPTRSVDAVLKDSISKSHLRSFLLNHPECLWETKESYSDELEDLSSIISALSIRGHRSQAEEFWLSELSKLLLTLTSAAEARSHYRYYAYISRRSILLGLRIPNHDAAIPDPDILRMAGKYDAAHIRYLALKNKAQEAQWNPMYQAFSKVAGRPPHASSVGMGGGRQALQGVDWTPLRSLPTSLADSKHSRCVKPSAEVIQCFGGYHQSLFDAGKLSHPRCKVCALYHAPSTRCLYDKVPGKRTKAWRRVWAHAAAKGWSTGDVDEWNLRHKNMDGGKYLVGDDGLFVRNPSAITTSDF